VLLGWTSLNLSDLKEYLKTCDNYKVHQAFFETCDPELLFGTAAAYCFPSSVALEDTIEKKQAIPGKRSDLSLSEFAGWAKRSRGSTRSLYPEKKLLSRC
jgi:hypothetical protein